MKVKYLKWDSDFFGLKIGMLKCSKFSKIALENKIQYLRKRGYKLIYLFINPSKKQLKNTAILLGGIDANTKVIYSKKILNNSKEVKFKERNITDYTYNESDKKKLITLGLQTGIYSRFYIDNRFPKGSYEELYKYWIIYSAKKHLADIFFVYKIKSKIIGYVAVKIIKNSLDITLIAVDQNYRGQGIGKMLLEYLIGYAKEQSYNEISISTHYENKPMIKFLTKYDFKLKEKTSIIHFWIN